MDTSTSSDSILNLFGPGKEPITANYKIIKNTDPNLNNRVVRLTLKDPKHVTLLLDHPWLLNGNYSTVTSVLIMDNKGGVHHTLSWIIANKLKQLMPIGDVGYKDGYSVYNARFRTVDGSDKMHLFIKDFKHIQGDKLKFPVSSASTPITHLKVDYTHTDPFDKPIAVSSDYNTLIPNKSYDNPINIKVGQYEFPFSNSISITYKGTEKIIDRYKLIITYTSVKFLINNSKVSEYSTPKATFYKYGSQIYQSFVSTYGAYDSALDLSRPRAINYFEANLDKEATIILNNEVNSPIRAIINLFTNNFRILASKGSNSDSLSSPKSLSISCMSKHNS